MSGALFSSMFCIAVVVIGAVIALVVMLLNPNMGKKNKVVQDLTARVSKSSGNGWQRWLLPFGIALILAIWTIWGALFFLAVVWLMRKNPAPNSSYTVGEEQKKTAKRIYAWLFWSSIITVPVFGSMVDNLSWQYSSTNERVLAALVPLIFHAVLLLGLTSKSAFVYRHTQQGILLMAIRATTAAMAVSIGRYPTDGLWLFILGNGCLWIFGTIWGRNQVVRGDCWWMRRKGETVQIVADKIASHPAHVHLEKSRAFIGQFKKNEAFQHALAAFRKGDREIKAQAVQILDTLDEVEIF